MKMEVIMKAILHKKYGPPEGMYLGEIETPTIKEHELLIQIHASTVTIGDTILRKLPRPVAWLFGVLMGSPRKIVPGHELAGVVTAVGSQITRFKVSDAVFGTTTGRKMGANAEYVALPESWKQGMLAHKPVKLSFAEAAALPIGAVAALQLLRKADIQPGQSVVVYGASGSLGSYAVQIARVLGAEVTAICSAGNHDWVRELGAARTFDYHEADFATQAGEHDVVFAAVTKLSKADRQTMLKPGGTFISAMSMTNENDADLEWLAQQAEAGLLRAHIDRRYPLTDVPTAHAYVDAGHKKGNVVIEIIPDSK